MALMESGPGTSSHSDGVPSMLPAHVEAPITPPITLHTQLHCPLFVRGAAPSWAA